jgi:fatty acid desaturase
MNITKIKYLPYREDIRSIVFILLNLCLLLIPLTIEVPSWLVIYWVIVSCLFCFASCVINHNHVHTAIFLSKKYNKLLSIVLTIVKGHTSSGVIVAHNLNHHVYNGDENDWIRVTLAGKGPGIIRLIRYMFKASVSMAKGRASKQATQLDRERNKSIRIERIFLLIFIGLCLLSDPYRTIIFVGVPWGVGMMLLVGVNLLQHDECDPSSKYDHSRNFTNRFGNWFLFNNGYHTIHHICPGMHWSRLPEKHLEIETKINKKYNRYSILKYLITVYVLRT